MDFYKPRILDHLLKRKLSGKGAVLIEGPKWCEKTTTAEQTANSILYMANPTHLDEYLNLADIDPSLLLEGATPRLIDELQIAPQLWDAIRFEIDRRNQERTKKLMRSYARHSGQSVPLETLRKDILNNEWIGLTVLRSALMSTHRKRSS